MEKKKFIRRKRLSRPKTLTIFGILFLILPVVNYFIIARQFNIKYTFPLLIFNTMTYVELILLFLPIVVGIGLLMIKKWGWHVFLTYAAILIAYNVYALFKNPVIYNMGAIFQTILGVAAVTYFSRRDISAPYFKMYPRGWRMQKRKPITVDVVVDGIPLRTRDLSLMGLYVDWADCPRNPNDSVSVKFGKNGNAIEIIGGVVRIDSTGAGIAFRDLAKENVDSLRELVRKAQ